MSQLNVNSIKHSTGTGPGIDITSAGNVSFDTSTLFVDSVNDKVGINTVNPTASLEVGGTGGVIFNSVPLRELSKNQSGTVNSDPTVSVYDGNVYFYNTASTANWVPNIIGNSGNTFDSVLQTGQICVVTMITRCGGSSGRPTSFNIDGSGRTVYWNGGAAPTARGGTTGFDQYQYHIVKTAANTFTVFGTAIHFE